MNILYFLAESASYMNQWQRVHIIDELERAGHRVTVFNPYLYRSLDEANEKLPEVITSATPRYDVFINPAPSTYLFKVTMQKVKSTGLPSLLICFDNLHAPFIHREIAPYFDLVWLTSRETEYLFKTWGCNTIFRPYAANPHFFKPLFKEEISKVGFIGTLYDDRARRINQLTGNSIPCTIYSSQLIRSENQSTTGKLNKQQIIGLLYRLSKFRIGRKVAYGRIKNKLFSEGNQLLRNDFLELLPSVPFEEMGSIYANYALSLNITELRNTFTLKHPIHKLHLRTFEIPACGGLQIAPYVEELAAYFEDGKEIILCRNDEEFISKSKFYLKPENASLRLQMKQNARKRAEAEHSWGRRFEEVFLKLRA